MSSASARKVFMASTLPLHPVVSFFRDVQESAFQNSSDRIFLNSSNWPILFLPGSINFVLALLSRWPDTQILRLLLLPLSALCCIHTASRYSFGGQGYFVYNAGLAAISLTLFAQALDFTFSATHHKLGYEKSSQTAVNGKKSCLEALSEASQLMLTVRGIGFEYGRSIPLPEEKRPLQKWPFLKKTSIMFIRSFITFDIIEFVLKFTPPLQTPEGGTMYIQSLPFFQRIILATIIHIFTGFFVIETIQAGYYLATLVFVGVFNHPPSLWPPVFDRPWASESLQQFWGRGWHQLLRHTFLVTGGYPCGWLGQQVGLGRIGMLFGAFFASGLYHEIPCYLINGYFDWITPLYFVSQAFLIYLEHAWTSLTGKKVRGWWGRLWVYFSLFVLAQPLVNSWHMRGVLSGMVLHGKLSLCRQLILPILSARFGSAFHLEPGY